MVTAFLNLFRVYTLSEHLRPIDSIIPGCYEIRLAFTCLDQNGKIQDRNDRVS